MQIRRGTGGPSRTGREATRGVETGEPAIDTIAGSLGEEERKRASA